MTRGQYESLLLYCWGLSPVYSSPVFAGALSLNRTQLAAKALLHRLNDEPPKVLVQDWYKTDQTRLVMRSAEAEVLDRELPQDGYDRVLFQAKCNNVFHLVLDHAAQGRKWAA